MSLPTTSKPAPLSMTQVLLCGATAITLNPHLAVDLANRVWSCF